MHNTQRLRACLTITLLSGVLAFGNAQTLTWLGNLGGYPNSGARAVSPRGPNGISDGPTVVGWASSTVFYDHAFRWTPGGGMQDLGTFGGNWSSAWGISSDGTTVVGEAYLGFHPNAFRWTVSGGLQNLGTLGGTVSAAYDASSNGSVIVGTAADSSGNLIACRWVGGTITSLGTLVPGGTSIAYGVSASGNVIVGGATDASGAMQAFYWTSTTGMVNLGAALGTPASSTALGISGNGNIVVGWSENTSGVRRARRADLTTSMVINLGHLGGNWAEALSTNWDGSIVVGWSKDSSGNLHAFRWTSAGIEDLNVSYAPLLSGGSFLIKAEGISPGGRYIVGQGYDARNGSYESAFLLDTCVVHNGDVDENGCVDDADLLAILFAFGTEGELGRVDVNCDGVVDDADLLIVLFNFGTGC